MLKTNKSTILSNASLQKFKSNPRFPFFYFNMQNHMAKLRKDLEGLLFQPCDTRSKRMRSASYESVLERYSVDLGERSAKGLLGQQLIIANLLFPNDTIFLKALYQGGYHEAKLKKFIIQVDTETSMQTYYSESLEEEINFLTAIMYYQFGTHNISAIINRIKELVILKPNIFTKFTKEDLTPMWEDEPKQKVL